MFHIIYKYVMVSFNANTKKFDFGIKQTRFANNKTFKRQSGLSTTPAVTASFFLAFPKIWRLQT